MALVLGGVGGREVEARVDLLVLSLLDLLGVVGQRCPLGAYTDLLLLPGDSSPVFSSSTALLLSSVSRHPRESVM